MREKESAILSAFSFLLLLLFAFVKVALATVLRVQKYCSYWNNAEEYNHVE